MLSEPSPFLSPLPPNSPPPGSSLKFSRKGGSLSLSPPFLFHRELSFSLLPPFYSRRSEKDFMKSERHPFPSFPSSLASPPSPISSFVQGRWRGIEEEDDGGHHSSLPPPPPFSIFSSLYPVLRLDKWWVDGGLLRPSSFPPPSFLLLPPSRTGNMEGRYSPFSSLFPLLYSPFA